jgi:hypothetical protein
MHSTIAEQTRIWKLPADSKKLARIRDLFGSKLPRVRQTETVPSFVSETSKLSIESQEIDVIGLAPVETLYHGSQWDVTNLFQTNLSGKNILAKISKHPINQETLAGSTPLSCKVSEINDYIIKSSDKRKKSKRIYIQIRAALLEAKS